MNFDIPQDMGDTIPIAGSLPVIKSQQVDVLYFNRLLSEDDLQYQVS